MEGWIKLHRKLKNWEWYDDINTSRLFIHLLLSVNHSEQKWRGIVIKKGQLLTGRKSLAKQTSLTEQQIRTSLNKLKSTNDLTIKSTKQYSIIDLTNWNDHQQINQQPNQQVTNEQPTSNHKQECNNDKNENKNNTFLKELEILKTDWNKKTVEHKSSNPSARNGEIVFTTCRKITPDIKKEYKAKRKNYSYEDIRHGIGQYYLDIIGRTEDTEKNFHTHRFSFYEFLGQKNGLTKFINK